MHLLFILLQAEVTLPEASRKEYSLSLLDLAIKGGWVMIPIFLLLLYAIYLFIERYLSLNRLGKVDDKFVTSVCSAIEQGDARNALNLTRAQSTAISRILEKGILRLGSPINEIESGMENQSKVETGRMEEGVGTLGAIAALAPMFGFLGTVFGMIQAFSNIAVSDNLSIGVISEGIYTKMVTSAAGLIVGIIAHSLYLIINATLDKRLQQIEIAANEFVDFLYQPRK
jgi:biopolymer transport protein ExbB